MISISSKDLLKIIESETINLNEEIYPIKAIKLSKTKKCKVSGKIICEDKLEIFFVSYIRDNGENSFFLKNSKIAKRIKLKQEI